MSIKIVGIIGSGLMGTGIAQSCATAGLNVIVRDIDPAALKRCIAQVASSLTRLVDKQKLTEPAKAATTPGRASAASRLILSIAA